MASSNLKLSEYFVSETVSATVEILNFSSANSYYSNSFQTSDGIVFGTIVYPKFHNFPNHVSVDFYASQMAKEFAAQYRLSIVGANQMKLYSQGIIGLPNRVRQQFLFYLITKRFSISVFSHFSKIRGN